MKRPVHLVYKAMLFLLLAAAAGLVYSKLGSSGRADSAADVSVRPSSRHLAYYSAERPLKPWTEYSAIAHALGGIDGKDYSNSLEALRSSYSKGFKIFETDLALTEDNRLIARHDWGTALQPSLPEDKMNLVLSRDEFMSYKIYDRYTPLDLEAIARFMVRHPDMYLITDTKQTDPEIIRTQFQLLIDTLKRIDEKLLERIIPEVYTHEMDEIINSLYPFRSHEFYSIYLTYEEPEDIIAFVKEQQIPVVAMLTEQATQEFLGDLSANHIKPYIYTVNDPQEIKNFASWGAVGFYTDFLTPGDIDKAAQGKKKSLF